MSERPPVPSAAGAPSWPRRVLPFAVAVALVGWVLSRLDFPTFVRELRRVDHALYVGFAVVFIVALLVADTFATVSIYRRTIAPIRYRDFFVLRGASYVPSMLNHHLGQAFLTYFMARLTGTPLLRTAGVTLLSYASWAGCVLGLGALALVLAGQPAAWLLAPLGAGLLYLALIALRPRALAGMRLLAPLFEAGVVGHLAALVTRLPHVAVLFLGTWLPFRFFGVEIPFAAAVAYVPILMVAVTLPITPQGLGTRDLLAATFFVGYAPGDTQEERLAVLAAATTSWVVVSLLASGALGLVLMRFAMPHLALVGLKTANASPSPSGPDSPRAGASSPPTP